MCPVLGWGYCGQKREFLEEVASELSWAGGDLGGGVLQAACAKAGAERAEGSLGEEAGEGGTGLAGAQPAERVSIFQLRS